MKKSCFEWEMAWVGMLSIYRYSICPLSICQWTGKNTVI